MWKSPLSQIALWRTNFLIIISIMAGWPLLIASNHSFLTSVQLIKWKKWLSRVSVMLHLKQIKQLQEPLWKWQPLSFIFEYTWSRIINIRLRRNYSPKITILSSLLTLCCFKPAWHTLFCGTREEQCLSVFGHKIKPMGSNVVFDFHYIFFCVPQNKVKQ